MGWSQVVVYTSWDGVATNVIRWLESAPSLAHPVLHLNTRRVIEHMRGLEPNRWFGENSGGGIKKIHRPGFKSPNHESEAPSRGYLTWDGCSLPGLAWLQPYHPVWSLAVSPASSLAWSRCSGVSIIHPPSTCKSQTTPIPTTK